MQTWRSTIPVVTATVVLGLLTAPPAPAAAAAPTCGTVGLGVDALHGPNFYVDTDAGLRGAYAGYRVTDTSAAPRRDVWVALTGFTGGSVGLGTGQAAAMQIPTLRHPPRPPSSST